MKTRGSPVLRLALLPFLASLTHCEPAEGPPAASAQNATAEVPLPAPAPAPAEPAADEGADTQYASAEYPVGEETDAYDDNDPSALKDFKGTLDPYGSWVDDKKYGTVWTPAAATVGADFTPYATAGHWVYDDDWVWVSDYPWGWAPFHYGRWVLIEGRGWAWIPGRVYRGAWVVWGVDDGYSYLGWAPMGPEFVWFGGVAVGWSLYLGPRWVYCPRREIFAPGVGGRIVAGPSAAPIAARMHTYVPAAPGVGGAPGGPSPQHFGYTPAQVPHATGAATQSLAQAHTFARPSSALAAGASPPTRVPLPTVSRSAVSGSRPAYSRPSVTYAPPSSGGSGASVPRPSAGPTVHTPSAAQAPVVRSTPTTPVPARPHTYSPPAAAAHSQPPSFHAPAPSGGGGHHR